jgi:hypothetical protein
MKRLAAVLEATMPVRDDSMDVAPKQTKTGDRRVVEGKPVTID